MPNQELATPPHTKPEYEKSDAEYQAEYEAAHQHEIEEYERAEAARRARENRSIGMVPNNEIITDPTPSPAPSSQKKGTILVIGDLLTDIYLHTKPANDTKHGQHVYNVTSREVSSGGCYNVIKYIDAAGYSAKFVCTNPAQGNSKTRIFGLDLAYRFDHKSEHSTPTSQAEISERNALLQTLIKTRIKEDNITGIVVSDYGQGLNPDIFKFIVTESNLHNIPIFFDPHESRNIEDYPIPTATPNFVFPNLRSFYTTNIYRHLRAYQHIIWKQGRDGACVYKYGSVQRSVPGIPLEPVDTTAAGDQFIASFTTKFLSSRNLISSVLWAVSAASAQCLHKGTSPVTDEQIAAMRELVYC